MGLLLPTVVAALAAAILWVAAPPWLPWITTAPGSASPVAKPEQSDPTSRVPPAADVDRIALPAGVPVVVKVDVGSTHMPYTVALGGKPLMRNFTSREETVTDLPVGSHTLTWAFNHTQRNWRHRLSAAAGGVSVSLDDKSEAARDPSDSVGSAVFEVFDPMVCGPFT